MDENRRELAAFGQNATSGRVAEEHVEQKVLNEGRSFLVGRHARSKAMGQQIGEGSEDLPLRRGVREAVIEADIKDKRFPRRVADGPEISHHVASKKRLCEVSEFARESDVFEERVRNGQRLPKLCTAQRPCTNS